MNDRMHDLIRRFRVALPKVREWINQYMAAHVDLARPVSSLGFERLATCYPGGLLDSAKVVWVDRVQFPPVDKFGLPEFSGMLQMPFDGITFKDTFFLRKGLQSESIHFHEMVHVVQWAKLGVDNFLLAYGLGLAQSGYEQSPLEAMAYTLQHQFDSGVALQDLQKVIEEQTDAIWSRAAPVVLAT